MRMPADLAKINFPTPHLHGRVSVILRVPALRESGRVIFPGIGPMSDEEFVDLLRDALARRYRVYVKELPRGQAAVPIIKTNRAVSLIDSQLESVRGGYIAWRRTD